MLHLNGAFVSATATRREGAVAGDGNSVLRCRGTAYFLQFGTISLIAQFRVFMLQAVMDLHLVGEVENLKQILVDSVALREIIHGGKLSCYTWKYFRDRKSVV